MRDAVVLRYALKESDIPSTLLNEGGNDTQYQTMKIKKTIAKPTGTKQVNTKKQNATTRFSGSNTKLADYSAEDWERNH